MNHLKYSIAAVLVISGVLHLRVAAAAEATDNPAALEEIVVTAQKRSENLEKVPIAVTALNVGDLQGSSIDSQLTLPKLTPNLNFTVVATFVAPYIRGVGTEYGNPGLESSVPVYFDDTYLPRAASGIFDFTDIERIEVLKGPQGTLYGRNATGGAIRIITNDPKLGTFEGSAGATYGSYDRVKVDGVVNLPLGDKVALRLAFDRDQDSGYLSNSAPDRESRSGDRNSAMYTGKLLVELTDNLKVKISGDYGRKNDNEGMTFQNIFTAPQQIGQVVGGCVSKGFYDICNDDLGVGDRVAAGGVTGRVDYDFGPALFSSITAYRSETENDFADIDATGADLFHTHGQPETRQLTQELQVTSELPGPLRYVAGFYYLHERSQYDYNAYGEAIDEDFGGTNVDFRAQGTGVETYSYAPYFQVDYDLTDQFSITFGARYTSEKKTLLYNEAGIGEVTPDGYLVPGTFSGPLTGVCTTPGQELCSQTNTVLKFNKFTPKLTLSYKPDQANLIYLTASRGFKSGGFNLPSFGTVDKVNPEVLDDLEVGWKYDSGPIRLNSAAFFYKYTNVQVQITDPVTADTFVRNGADAHIYGLESDLSWLVSDRIEVGAGGGFLHARYTSFVDGNTYVPNYTTAACAASPAACLGNSSPPANLSGYPLENAPDFTGYVRGQYTQPLGDRGKLLFSSIANYRSKAYFDLGDQLPDAARMLVSARIQWNSATDKYSVAVYGDNLTGKEYYLSRTLQATGGFQVPAPPRVGYITANVKF